VKKGISLLYFQIFTFLKSSKFVMPSIFLLVLQLSIYYAIQAKPVDFMNAIFQAEFYAFIIAIWLGFSSNDLNDGITEQLLILRAKKEVLYYSINVVFLFVISAFISLISVIIPLVFHFVNKGEFFDHVSSGGDFLLAFFLFLGSSFAGVSLGALFHPRIIKEKKFALLYVLLAGLFSIARVSMVDDQEMLKYVMWVFPTLANHSTTLRGGSYFSSIRVGQLFLISLFYGLSYSYIKILILIKRKF